MTDVLAADDLAVVQAAPAAPGKAFRRDRREQLLFREAVIAAARDLFLQEGADGLSMRRIAASVGTAPMTLYRYFPSKQHLLRHIWNDLLDASLAVCQRAAAEQSQPLARPGAFAGQLIAHWAAQPGNYLLVFTAGSSGAVGSRAHVDDLPAIQRHVDALQVLLDDCVQPLAWPVAERRRLVEWVICQCFGYLHPMVYLANFDWRDPDMLRRELVTCIDEHVRVAAAALRQQTGDAMR